MQVPGFHGPPERALFGNDLLLRRDPVLVVPDGVTSMQITAIGGAGAVVGRVAEWQTTARVVGRNQRCQVLTSRQWCPGAVPDIGKTGGGGGGGGRSISGSVGGGADR